MRARPSLQQALTADTGADVSTDEACAGCTLSKDTGGPVGLEAWRRGWLRGVAQWVPGDASRGVGETGLQPSAVLGPRETLLCIPPDLWPVAPTRSSGNSYWVTG